MERYIVSITLGSVHNIMHINMQPMLTSCSPLQDEHGGFYDHVAP